METLFFITVTGWLWYLLGRLDATKPRQLAAKPASPQLIQALALADRLYAEKHYIKAEKAYVAVLKLDHHNLLAYNRLGIIYSVQKNHVEAIECFEVAARHRPSATAYFNLGLAYYENKNYVKASAALKKSIMFEPSLQRYVALAKACDRVSDTKGKLEALEAAVELEPTRQTLILLRDAYHQAGRKEQLNSISERLKALPQGQTPPKTA